MKFGFTSSYKALYVNPCQVLLQQTLDTLAMAKGSQSNTTRENTSKINENNNNKKTNQ